MRRVVRRSDQIKTVMAGGTICPGVVKALGKFYGSHNIQVGLVRTSCEAEGQEVPLAICTACGYYTTSKAIGLGKRCPRVTTGRRSRLDRVAGGLHPDRWAAPGQRCAGPRG